MSNDMNDKRLLMGVITGASGIKGDVKITCYTEEPENIVAYGPLSSEDGETSYDLDVKRLTKAGVIVRIDGVKSREDAEALRGTKLYVSREVLPDLEDEDEFYVEDLVDLKVQRSDGEALGTVKAVQNYGAGDLIEVRLENGKVLDLPFTREVVPTIDMAGRLVIVDVPAELDPKVQAAEKAEAKKKRNATSRKRRSGAARKRQKAKVQAKTAKSAQGE